MPGAPEPRTGSAAGVAGAATFASLPWPSAVSGTTSNNPHSERLTEHSSRCRRREKSASAQGTSPVIQGGHFARSQGDPGTGGSASFVYREPPVAPRNRGGAHGG